MIQEQQKKIQEEEERIRKEMEEKERKLEEARKQKEEAVLKFKIHTFFVNFVLLSSCLINSVKIELFKLK